MGAGRDQREYSEATIGRKSEVDGPIEGIIDAMVGDGSWIVGTPDDCIAGIHRLAERSGGFGGFLVQALDWAPREELLHSYELLARYVMPQFQASLDTLAVSNEWSRSHIEELGAMRTQSIDRARQVWTERK